MKKIFLFTLTAFVFANASAQFLYTLSAPDTLQINYNSSTDKRYLSTDIKDIDFSDDKKIVVNKTNNQSDTYYRNSLQNIRFISRYSSPKTLLSEERFGAYEGLFYTNYQYYNSFYFLSCLASDEMLGGGGIADPWAGFDYLSANINEFKAFETATYESVYKINELIKKVDQLPEEVDQKIADHTKGEMLFLRAYHHYELASLLEQIQVITDNESWEQRVKTFTPEEIWGQIMLDLKNAINLMDGSLCPSLHEDGRVSRYAAEAMLARAFLFYTGFYQGKHNIAEQEASVNLPDGSTLTKQDVIDYLAECISQSPFYLVSDFRNLWPYTNRYTVEENPETAGLGLKWVEDDWAINPEVLFKVRYNTKASWMYYYSSGYANLYALAFGHRMATDQDSYQQLFPIGGGWGAGSVAPNLYDDWNTAEPNDMRRNASIQDVYQTQYPLFAYNRDYAQLTQYHEKKISPIIGKQPSSYNGWGDYQIFEVMMYYGSEYNIGTSNAFQSGSIHPLNLIRMSDVMLMHSELTGTVDGINQVRARAGLQPLVSYSLEALQQERRWELAFEGVRWNDMRRWGDAYCMAALDKQLNQPIVNLTDYTTNTPDLFECSAYSQQYAKTHGFFKTHEGDTECQKAYEALAGSWTYGKLQGMTYGTLKYNGASAQDFVGTLEGMIAGYSLDQMKLHVNAAEGEVTEFAHMVIEGDNILKISALGDTLARGTITLHETNNYDWRICTAEVSGNAVLGNNGCSKFDVLKLDDQLVLVDATSKNTNDAAQFWVFRYANNVDMTLYNIANKKWSYAVSRVYDWNTNQYNYTAPWGWGGWNSSSNLSIPVLYCAQLEGVSAAGLAAQASSWGITDVREADPYAYMQFNLNDMTVSKFTRNGELIAKGEFEVEPESYEVIITVHNHATLFPYSYYGAGETVEQFGVRYSQYGYECVDINTDILTLRELNSSEQFTFWAFGQRGLTSEELAEQVVISQFDKNDAPAADGCYFAVSFKDGKNRTFGYDFADGTRIIPSGNWARPDVTRGTTCQKDLRVWVLNCNNDTASVTRTLTFNMDTKPASQVVIYDNPAGATGTAWDASCFRFSDNEGLNFPYITDEQFLELVGKELHFTVIDAQESPLMRVMNGWWSATYYDNLPVEIGDFNFVVTEEMADDCRRGGQAKDLVPMLTSGKATISKVYYYNEQ